MIKADLHWRYLFLLTLLWLAYCWVNMPLTYTVASEVLAPTPTWAPPARIASGELRMRRLDPNGATLGTINCSPGDTHYGCTAFCDDFGDPLYPCPNGSPISYPYDSAWPALSYQDDYLLDVVAQETGSNEFADTAVYAQTIVARSYAYYHTGNDITMNNSTTFHAFIPYKFETLGPVPENTARPCASANLSAAQYEVCTAVGSGYYLSWDDPRNPTFLPARANFMGDVVERTASSGDKAYLLGVEDPVSNFNATCPAANTAVFTYGMSQQGAHRWATGDQCGPFTSTVNSWSVQWTRPEQILFHYYTDVHIRDGNKQVVTALSPLDRWNPLQLTAALEPSYPAFRRDVNYSAAVLVQNTGLSAWACTDDVTGYHLRYQWAKDEHSPTGGGEGVIGCGLAQSQAAWTNLIMAYIPSWGYGDYTLHLDVTRQTTTGSPAFSPAWATYTKTIFVFPTDLWGGYTAPAPGAEVNYSVNLTAQAGGDDNSAGVARVLFRAQVGAGRWQTVAEDGTACPIGQTCVYNATWDVAGIPNHTEITLGFDVVDHTGTAYYSPQGTRAIIIHDVPPRSRSPRPMPLAGT